MGNDIVATAAWHIGFAPSGSLVVPVNIIFPLAISAAEGVYTTAKAVLLSNEPLPLLVHIIEVAPPPIVADKLNTPSAQIAPFPFTDTVGGFGQIQTITLALTCAVAVQPATDVTVTK